MKSRLKGLLAWVLVLGMVISLIPSSAFSIFVYKVEASEVINKDTREAYIQYDSGDIANNKFVVTNPIPLTVTNSYGVRSYEDESGYAYGLEHLTDKSFDYTCVEVNCESGYEIYFEANGEYIVDGYQIVTAENPQSGVPLEWQLYGSNTNSGFWERLDCATITDAEKIIPFVAYAGKEYTINNNNAYKYFKLNVSRSTGDELRLSEILLTGTKKSNGMEESGESGNYPGNSGESGPDDSNSDDYGQNENGYIYYDIEVNSESVYDPEKWIIPAKQNSIPVTLYSYSGINAYGGEDADNLVDNTFVKVCGKASENYGLLEGISFILDAGESKIAKGYQLITANDTASSPARNPYIWTVYGTNDINTEEWTTISSVNVGKYPDMALPAKNYTGREYSMNNDQAYRYYKFEITELSGTDEGIYNFQLSEFVLLSKVRTNNSISDDSSDSDEEPEEPVEYVPTDLLHYLQSGELEKPLKWDTINLGECVHQMSEKYNNESDDYPKCVICGETITDYSTADVQSVVCKLNGIYYTKVSDLLFDSGSGLCGDTLVLYKDVVLNVPYLNVNVEKIDLNNHTLTLVDSEGCYQQDILNNCTSIKNGTIKTNGDIYLRSKTELKNVNIVPYDNNGEPKVIYKGYDNSDYIKLDNVTVDGILNVSFDNSPMEVCKISDTKIKILTGDDIKNTNFSYCAIKEIEDVSISNCNFMLGTYIEKINNSELTSCNFIQCSIYEITGEVKEVNFNSGIFEVTTNIIDCSFLESYIFAISGGTFYGTSFDNMKKINTISLENGGMSSVTFKDSVIDKITKGEFIETGFLGTEINTLNGYFKWSTISDTVINTLNGTFEWSDINNTVINESLSGKYTDCTFKGDSFERNASGVDEETIFEFDYASDGAPSFIELGAESGSWNIDRIKYNNKGTYKYVVQLTLKNMQDDSWLKWKPMIDIIYISDEFGESGKLLNTLYEYSDGIQIIDMNCRMYDSWSQQINDSGVRINVRHNLKYVREGKLHEYYYCDDCCKSFADEYGLEEIWAVDEDNCYLDYISDSRFMAIYGDFRLLKSISYDFPYNSEGGQIFVYPTESGNKIEFDLNGHELSNICSIKFSGNDDNTLNLKNGSIQCNDIHRYIELGFNNVIVNNVKFNTTEIEAQNTLDISASDISEVEKIELDGNNHSLTVDYSSHVSSGLIINFAGNIKSLSFPHDNAVLIVNENNRQLIYHKADSVDRISSCYKIDNDCYEIILGQSGIYFNNDLFDHDWSEKDGVCTICGYECKHDNDNSCSICGYRKPVKVVVTSRVEGGDTTVANLTGGGNYLYGEEVTLSAEYLEGYTFKGWYAIESSDSGLEPGESGLEVERLYCDTLDYTFVIEDDIKFVAKYEANASVTVTVNGINGAEYTVGDSTTVQIGSTEEVLIGSTLVLKAADPTKVMAWVSENGKILGTGATLKLPVTGNTTVKLMYRADREGQAMVEYVSDFNQIIAYKSYSVSDKIKVPAGPSKAGNIFIEWNLSEEEIKEKIAAGERHIVVKPVYESTGTTYNVTVNYPDDTVEVSADIAEGEGYDVTAKDIDGKYFAYWTDENDVVLGYTQTYHVKLTKNIILKAVYTDVEVDKMPVIAMTNTFTSTVDGNNKISYEATRSIPDGYTLKEHGIIYVTEKYFDGSEPLTLDTANAKYSKSSANTKDGTFIFNLNVTKNEDVVVYVTGYMILVNNRTGAEEKYYAENMVSGSFNGLSK